MDRYIKQIQTRMNRKLKSRGQSVTKQQVRDVYSQVVTNPEKPTDLEISRVTELLAQKLSSLRAASLRDATRTRTQEETSEEVIQDGQLTISTNTEIQTENQKPATLEISPEDNTDLWETLQPPQSQELAFSSTEPSLPTTPLSETSHASQSEEAGELAIAESDTNLSTHKPEERGAIGITKAQIEEAVELAIAQTGESGSAEAKLIMTQLALHLSGDINTLEQAVAALVTGYLNKRSNVLKNAIGALNTLRNAQTSSFCGGLTPDFLAKQEAAKNHILEIANIFN